MAKTISEYHRKMKCILNKIFEMDDEYIVAFFHGDPFDKIVRNISTRSENGEVFYNNKKMLSHYPRSKKADEIANNKKLSDEQKVKLLYLEHDVPLKVVKDKLRDKNNRSQEQLSPNLGECLKVTLITKEEAGQINKKYKSSMPEEDKTRYEAMVIQLITKHT